MGAGTKGFTPLPQALDLWLRLLSPQYYQTTVAVDHHTEKVRSRFSCNAGLMGGHSGLNINEDRGNAVRFVGRVADAILAAAPGTALASVSGGDKRNAIPREAAATVLVR